MDGNNDEYDHDDDELDVPLFGEPGESPPMMMEQPPDGYRWDDTAIIECFQRTVMSHDQKIDDPSFDWFPSTHTPNSKNFLATWEPKSLSLPLWSQDIFPNPAKVNKTESQLNPIRETPPRDR